MRANMLNDLFQNGNLINYKKQQINKKKKLLIRLLPHYYCIISVSLFCLVTVNYRICFLKQKNNKTKKKCKNSLGHFYDFRCL